MWASLHEAESVLQREMKLMKADTPEKVLRAYRNTLDQLEKAKSSLTYECYVMMYQELEQSTLLISSAIRTYNKKAC